jgi:hypothetical protein
MELVHDEEEDEEDAGQTRRNPVKLRGRGGFSHPRNHGRGTHDELKFLSSDPVDGLASSMSALKFVPHSVRMARGRGRGS